MADVLNILDIPSGGVSDFLGLTDTPGSYAGSALLGVRVNAGATALEFAAAGGGQTATVKLGNAAAQSIPDSTVTTLTRPVVDEVFDVGGFHDGVNPTRITVPAGQAGKYAVGFDLEWEASAGGQFRRADIVLNGVTVVGRDNRRDIGSGAGTDENISNIYQELDLVATDFLEVEVEHDEGAALDILGVGLAYSPTFYAHRLS